MSTDKTFLLRTTGVGFDDGPRIAKSAGCEYNFNREPLRESFYFSDTSTGLHFSLQNGDGNYTQLKIDCTNQQAKEILGYFPDDLLKALFTEAKFIKDGRVEAKNRDLLDYLPLKELSLRAPSPDLEGGATASAADTAAIHSVLTRQDASPDLQRTWASGAGSGAAGGRASLKRQNATDNLFRPKSPGDEISSNKRRR